MSLQTPTENKALLRIGLGTQAKFSTLTTYDPGAIYVATQTDDTHVRMYVAQSNSKTYALSTDYADKAGGWSAGRNFAISGLPSATTIVNVDGTNSEGYVLNLPQTLGSSSNKFTTIYANTFNGTATNATTAEKLSTTAAGSATKPVYFANGIPVECDENLDIKAKAFHAPVTITLGGDLSGSVTFDGSSQNAALEAEVVGAGKVTNNLTLKFGTGTTEGQDIYTFNGETEKTAQLVVDGSYLKMTTAEGVVTIGPGSTLEGLSTDLITVRNDYTKHSEAQAYATDAATKMYNKILTGKEDGSGTGPAEALDTLYEIANALTADQTGLSGLLANINTRAKIDGSNIPADTTWNNLTVGKAGQWSTTRTFAISGTASAAAANGIPVDGSSASGYTLLLPQVLSGFTKITATTFEGTATNAVTATKLGTTDVGGASKPIYLKAGVPTECTSISLTAATAEKLVTGRKFAIGGLLTGTSVVSAANTTEKLFDGSDNCYIHVTSATATSLNTPIKLQIGAMENPVELNVSADTFTIAAEDIGSTVIWETF